MKKFILCLLFISASIPLFAAGDSASSSVLSSLHMESFDNIQSQAINGALELRSFARMIAGIGALCCMLVAIWNVWIKTDSTRSDEMWSFAFRAAAVFLLIVCFDVVPLFIDACVSPLESATAALNEEAKEEYLDKVNTFAEIFYSAQEEAEQKAESEESASYSVFSSVSKIFRVLRNVFSIKGFNTQINMAMNTICVIILEGLSKAVVVCLHVFSLVAKVILIILGPIVFALSMFPYFRDSIRIWLCRYINLCLYIPICNIIGYVLKHIYINIFYAPAIEILESGGEIGLLDIASSRSFMLLFLFVSIIMYCMVPKIAGWIIDGQGNGLIGSAVGSMAGVAGRYAAGSAGAAAGAAGAVK